jgi:hypothetical protein
MTVGIIAGNTASINIITATVDLGSVAANTSETETATVPGVKIGDFVIAEKPTLEAGLIIGTCWVSAADTVSIQVINTTAAPIDEASETWRFLVVGRDGPAVSAIQR